MLRLLPVLHGYDIHFQRQQEGRQGRHTQDWSSFVLDKEQKDHDYPTRSEWINGPMEQSLPIKEMGRRGNVDGPGTH